jgi:hypothetical protein
MAGALHVLGSLDAPHMLDSLGVLGARDGLGSPDINPMLQGLTYIICI